MTEIYYEGDDGLAIRAMDERDPVPVSAAFDALGWNKPVSQYERYLAEQRAGTRTVLIAAVGGRFAGYVTVRWQAHYEPFRGMPEIADFNVLPEYRRRGIGSALMDTAEALVARRSPTVAIGVGLYADYGTAQRMYVKRGYIPDGRGLMYDDRPVEPGSSVPIDDSATLMFSKDLTPPPGGPDRA